MSDHLFLYVYRNFMDYHLESFPSGLIAWLFLVFNVIFQIDLQLYRDSC